MTRMIAHAATEPRKVDENDIDPEKGDIAICQCGLSAEYPFCDGSHQATHDESDDVLYKYKNDDDENPRHAVEIHYADD